MENDLIRIRRMEVEREKKALSERLASLDEELHNLDITERTLASLSGAGRHSAGEKFKSNAETDGKTTAPEGLTVRQMVKEALMDARNRGLPGLAPKNIRKYIKDVHGRDIKQQANTVPWKMWHEYKEIEKNIDTGLFYMPSKEPAEGDIFE